MVVGLLDTVKGRVIVTENMLSIRSTFTNRDLLFSEIKGYKVGVEAQYIYILPNTHDKKRIKISTYVGKTDELIRWLSANFVDLRVENNAKEEREILDNYEYGRCEGERIEKLKNAKLTAKALNWAGGLVCAWTLFLAEPYEYAILASILVPLLSVLAAIFFRGLIKIDEKKGSAYPSVFLGILMPSCGLFLRALLDFNIYDYSNIWLPAASIALGLATIAIMATKEISFKKPQEFFTVLFLVLFFFGYSYGAVVTTNCYYDESIPQNHQAEIINKRISSGKTTTYYLELAPWADQIESNEVSVSEEFYDRIETGDSVNIYLKDGVYEIPWLMVTE